MERLVRRGEGDRAAKGRHARIVQRADDPAIAGQDATAGIGQGAVHGPARKRGLTAIVQTAVQGAGAADADPVRRRRCRRGRPSV